MYSIHCAARTRMVVGVVHCMNQVRLGHALDGGPRIRFEFPVEQGEEVMFCSTEVGDEQGWPRPVPYERVLGYGGLTNNPPHPALDASHMQPGLTVLTVDLAPGFEPAGRTEERGHHKAL